MTSTFEAMLARIDRTSPSLAEALPGIVRLFKMHEDKLSEFDKRIEKTNVDFMKKLDGLADHLDESRHRLHLRFDHQDHRATEAINGVTRMHNRVDFLEDRMTDMEARVPGPVNNTTPAALTRDIEELARRVDILTERLVAVEHSSNRIDQEADKLHTLVNDLGRSLSERLDVHRTDIDALEQKAAPVEVNVTADTESLTAYVHRLEALVNDIEKELKESIAASDRARVRGDDGMHDLVTRTANSLYAEIKKLEQRISDCELLVGTDKLVPEPPRDRLWHPHDVKKDSRCPVDAGEIVSVLIRGSDTPRPPEIAGRLHWGEMGALTIVGWRYAEGE